MANQDLTNENLRNFLRYEFDRGCSAPQAVQNINQTYGDGTVGRTMAYKWYARFRDGEFCVQDAQRPGRPVGFDRDRLEELLQHDNRQTTRELAEQMGCVHGTIENHLKKMGKVQKFGAWVPHEPSQRQNDKRVGKK